MSKQSSHAGVADKIPTTKESLEVLPRWNTEAITKRQTFLTTLAAKAWDASG